MKDKSPALIWAAMLLVAVVGFYFLSKIHFNIGPPSAGKAKPVERSARGGSARDEGGGESAASTATGRNWLAQVASMMFDLALRMKAKGALPNEAVLQFKDDAAYQRFLADAEKSGLRILNKIPRLNAVRVGFDELDALQEYLAKHPNADATTSPNYAAYYPTPPELADRVSAMDSPIGGSALPYLGLRENGDLGAGIIVAVLDSSIANIPALQGRLASISLTKNPITDLNHGTAVAALAAGETYGVLPKASILSVGVVSADGYSDSFTLADGVIAAADNGAKIINISLGSSEASDVLLKAIQYAQSQGAVIVASAGNDGYTNSSYPARWEGVIAATATDAAKQVTSFSNASQNFGFAAPGLETATYDAAGQLITFSGTSASAPLVAGSIGAVMSHYPGTTAAQAVEMLKTYADEGGALGPDPDFGYGSINLDRVWNSGVSGRTDAAVASHYYNAKDVQGASVEFVVENRGNTTLYNWQLETNADGQRQTWALPAIEPNKETSVRVPVNSGILQAGGQIEMESRLTPPQGIQDVNQKNNSRASTIVGPSSASAQGK
jgi:hypothetical protein